MKTQNNKVKSVTTLVASLIMGLALISPTGVFPNVSATTHSHVHPLPQLSSSENQAIINTALSAPGLQSWSHGWKYVTMGFGSNNKLDPDFQWQYALVTLKAPSSSAPVSCDIDWWAYVEIDMTTMKVISTKYPTMESHICHGDELGGPATKRLDLNNTEFSYVQSKIESPLKQIQSGITTNNVICNTGLTLIIKSEDGSPACVKPQSAQKLLMRGWAQEIVSNTSDNLGSIIPYVGVDKFSDIVSIANQTYYVTTFNGTLDSIPRNGTIIQFHQILFTLMKPLPSTANGYLYEVYAESTNDGKSEPLIIYPVGPGGIQSDIVLSKYTHPQSGFIVYQNTEKLLVNTDNQTNSDH